MDRVSFRAKSFCWVAVVWAALRLRSLPFLVSVSFLGFWVCAILFEASSTSPSGYVTRTSLRPKGDSAGASPVMALAIGSGSAALVGLGPLVKKEEEEM